jgi:hypothetical protein
MRVSIMGGQFKYYYDSVMKSSEKYPTIPTTNATKKSGPELMSNIPWVSVKMCGPSMMKGIMQNLI